MVRIVIGRRLPDYIPIITRNMDSIDSQFANRRNVALQPGTLQAALLDRLTRTLGKNLESATTAGYLRCAVARGARGTDAALAGHAAPRGERACQTRVLFLGRIPARPVA